MPTYLQGVAAAVISCAFTQTCFADRFVIVELSDGRYVSGDIDLNTNQKSLILRSTTPSIVMRSSFAWDRVVKARHGDRVYTPAGFQKLAERVRNREQQKQRPAKKKQSSNESSLNGPAFTSLKSKPGGVAKPPTPGRRTPDVAFLRVEASVANWDADAEADGVMVHIFPQSIDGHVLQVNGTLEVKLVGKSFNLATPHWKRDLFPKIGEWSHQLRQQDFHRWGAVVRLPFQKIHPELDLEIESTALLTARLSIPGKGTFAASDANVVLRPYSRIRDGSQLKRGSRLFPSEK